MYVYKRQKKVYIYNIIIELLSQCLCPTFHLLNEWPINTFVRKFLNIIIIIRDFREIPRYGNDLAGHI